MVLETTDQRYANFSKLKHLCNKAIQMNRILNFVILVQGTQGCIFVCRINKL